MAKKKKPIVLSELKDEEKPKYEIAGELGLLDRVLSDGWGSLSAKETGRIGGILRSRNKLTPRVKVQIVDSQKVSRSNTDASKQDGRIL